jgi:oligopeptide/dipeptide ABC transporter ATP-binding protein
VVERDKLLDVQGLKTYFETDRGVVKAVDDISYHVKEGETVGIVGESGCGKSVTALSIMNLVQGPRGRVAGGKIMYTTKGGERVEITALPPYSPKMRAIRGSEISMIFQEPMTALNPVYTIGEQIAETVCLHQKVSKKKGRERAIEMLELVGIAAPSRRINEYPHQLSGGMRQRAMIGMALSCDPRFLIADEPTTALDVTIEAQILDLMLHLQEKLGMAMQFITHDLGVISTMAKRVVVMYTGHVVEKASVDDIFYDPRHPYTKGLLASVPTLGRQERLVPIKGTVPNMNELPKGCYFSPRCQEAMDICHQEEPPSYQLEGDHIVKCWLWEQEGVRLP